MTASSQRRREIPYQNYHYYLEYYGPRSSRARASDEELRRDVLNAIGWDSWVDASQVEVEVSDGVVTLSGTVESTLQKRAAGDDAWDIPGVIDVRNNLRISGRD